MAIIPHFEDETLTTTDTRNVHSYISWKAGDESRLIGKYFPFRATFPKKHMH